MAEKKTTALIVDDERLARASLRAVLDGFPEIEVIAEAASAAEALAAVHEHRPGLIFLDIQLSGGSGFDLLAKIENPPPIIFVTAYDRYALRAFEVNALDYLVKPVEPERLRRSLERIAAMPEPSCCSPEDSTAPLQPGDSVTLNSGRRCTMVPLADMLLIRSEGNYTHVVLADGSDHLVRTTLTMWIDRLPGEMFVPLSRSLIINRSRVCGWEPEGRGLALHFRDSALTLRLSRTEAERFKV